MENYIMTHKPAQKIFFTLFLLIATALSTVPMPRIVAEALNPNAPEINAPQNPQILEESTNQLTSGSEEILRGDPEIKYQGQKVQTSRDSDKKGILFVQEQASATLSQAQSRVFVPSDGERISGELITKDGKPSRVSETSLTPSTQSILRTDRTLIEGGIQTSARVAIQNQSQSWPRKEVRPPEPLSTLVAHVPNELPRVAQILSEGNYSRPSVSSIQSITETLLKIHPHYLNFLKTPEKLFPASQTFTIKSTTEETVNFTIAEDISWLTLSAAGGSAGTNPFTITATVDATNLTSIESPYAGNITVSNTGNNEDVRTIRVRLEIQDEHTISSLRSFSPNGEVERTIQSDGNIVDQTYDNTGNLIETKYPNGTSVTYTYDQNGNRTSMTDESGTTVYQYDIYNRLIAVFYPGINPIIYTYDKVSNITSITYPDQRKVEYTYDEEKRMTSAKEGDKTTSYEYDLTTGFLSRQTYPNGVTTRYAYDANGWLTDLTHKKGTGELLEAFHYTLDSDGKRTSVSKETPEGTETTSYTYDALSRLTRATYPDGRIVTYEYDELGNRTRFVDSVNGETTYTYDQKNRLIQAGNEIFQYDANGNIVRRASREREIEYTYNFENQLVRVVNVGDITEFEYDGDGNRTAKIANGVRTNYVNHPTGLPQVLLEANASWQVTKIYTYGLERISALGPTEENFYLYDAPGRSVSNLTNNAGEITTTYNYDVFGTPTDNTNPNNSYLHNGEQYDKETGLIFLRTRYYDPTLGRFLSKDPSQGFPTSPQTLNPYTYAGADPINNIDPWGTFNWGAFGTGVLQIGLGALQAGFGIAEIAGGFGLATGGTATGIGAVPGIAAGVGLGVLGANNVVAGGSSMLTGGGNIVRAFQGKEANTETFDPLHSVIDRTVPQGTGNTLAHVGLAVVDTVAGGLGAAKGIGNLKFKGEFKTAEAVGSISVRGGGKFDIGIQARTGGAPAWRYHLGHHPINTPESIWHLGVGTKHIEAPWIPTAFKNTLTGIGAVRGLFQTSDALGGVSLNKTADFLLEIEDIKGGTYDPATGQIIFFGEANASLPKMEVEDLAVALHSVYGKGDPGVSIDPPIVNGNFSVRYEGETEKTRFGWIMFEADRVMKVLGVGKDNITGALVSSNVPGYKNLLNRLLERGSCTPGEQSMRFWFQPKEVRLVQSGDGNTMVFDEVSMEVLTESKFKDNVVGDPVAEAFASHFTAHYDEFAEEFSVLKDLKRLGKAVAVIKWIKDNHIPVDLSFIDNYTVEFFDTPEQTPSITVQGENGNCSTILKGGVTYRPPNEYLQDNPLHPLTNPIKDAIIANRPSETDFLWNFQPPQIAVMAGIASAHSSSTAVAESFARSRKDGNLNFQATDLMYQTNGTFPLELSRYYDSFADKLSEFGLGWSSLPYKLRFPVGKKTLTFGSENISLGLYERIWFQDRKGEQEKEFLLLGIDANNLPIYIRLDTYDILREQLDGIFRVLIKGGGTILFNTQGKLTSTKDQNNNLISYTYNENGKLARIETDTGQAITLTLNGEGLVAQATGPGAKIVIYGYDAANNLTSVTNAANQTTAYTYDSERRLTNITNADNNPVLSNTSYDVYNRANTYRIGLTQDAASDFSLKNRETISTITNTLATRAVFDDSYRLTEFTDEIGNKSTVSHHGIFGPEKIIGADGQTAQLGYDNRGNIAIIQDGNRGTSELFYDWLDRLIATRGPEGTEIAYGYNSAGNLVSVYHAVQLVQNEYGNLTSFLYDPNNVSTLTYDVKGNLMRAQNAEQNESSFTYTSNGQIETIEQANGVTTAISYDSRSRMNTISLPTTSIELTYDNADNLTNITTPSGTSIFEFNSIGNPTAITDTQGKRTELIYNENEDLSGLQDPTGNITTYERNAFGQLTAITLPNQTKITFDHDELGNPIAKHDVIGIQILPQLSILEDSLDFGEVAVGGTEQKSVMLYNLGRAPVSVSYSHNGLPNFSIMGTSSFSIAGGERAEIAVAFQPSAPGAKVATLTITSNDPTTPTKVIPLSGEGTLKITGLVATPKDNGIELTWDELSDFNAINFSRFNIYRATSTMNGDVSGLAPINTSITDRFVTSFFDSTAKPATSYYYAITAVYAGGFEYTRVDEAGPVAIFVSFDKIGGTNIFTFTGVKESNPSIAYSVTDNKYLVVYEKDISGNGTNIDIVGKIVSPTGGVGSEIVIAGDIKKELQPSIAYNSVANEYVVLYTHDFNGDGSDYDIRGQRVGSDGVLRGGWFLVGWFSVTEDNPSVSYNTQRNEYMAVFEVDFFNNGSLFVIYGTRFDAEGNVLSGPNLIGAWRDANGNLVARNEHRPQIAYNSATDQYLFTFEFDYNNNGSNWDIWGRRLTQSGSVIESAPIPVSSFTGVHEKNPSVVYNSRDNEFFTVFEFDTNEGDIAGSRLDASAGRIGSPFYVFASARKDKNPALAYNALSQDYMVVWELDWNGDGTDWDIIGQRISKDGFRLGFAYFVGGFFQNEHEPAIAYNAASNEFFVPWRHEVGATNWDIYAQRIGPENPKLQVAPTALDFGTETLEQTLTITNTGDGTLDWFASASDDWFSVSPSGARTSRSTQVTVTANRTGLSRGEYAGIIRIFSDGGNADIPVALTMRNGIPAIPSNPIPRDGAENAQHIDGTLRIVLSWDSSDSDGDPILFDVYASSDRNLVDAKHISANIASGLSSSTYQLSDLDFLTAYYWKVTARDSGGASSEGPTWSFITPAIPAPQPRAIQSPTNDNTPTFFWNPVVGAVSYHIQIAASSSFHASTTLAESDNLATTTFTPVSPFPDGSLYWHVRSRDAEGAPGPFTDTEELLVDTLSPASPLLIPITPERTREVRPVFSWQRVSDAASYEMQIATSAATSSPPFKEAAVFDTTFSPSADLPEGIIFWQVRSVDAASNRSAFATSSFTIDITPPPEITGLTATVATEGVIVGWSPVSNEDGDFKEFRIYRHTASFSNVSARVPIATSSDVSQAAYVDVSVNPEELFYYAVTAVDTAGNERKNVTSIPSRADLVRGPEMYVIQNGREVAPSSSIHLGVGTYPEATDVSFSIGNRGDAILYLLNATSVRILGALPDEWSVLLQPSSSVFADEASNFIIRFTPRSTGQKSAIVVIDSNDRVRETFTFVLEAEVVLPTPPTVHPYERVITTSTIFLSGTKDPYTSIFINNALAVPVSATTTWMHARVLQPGENILSLQTVDIFGNRSSSTEVSVMYSVVLGAPSAEPRGGTYGTSTLEIILTPPLGALATRYTQDGTLPTVTSTLYTGLPIVIVGSNGARVILHAASWNNEGFRGALMIETYLFDFTAPAVYGVEDDGAYNDNRTIIFSEGSATLNGSPFLSGGVVGAEGAYILSVTDAAGNTTRIHFVIDRTAPSSPILAPFSSLSDAPSIFLQGSAESGSTAMVSGGATSSMVLVSESGSFSLVYPLAQDTRNKLSIRAMDRAGNSSFPFRIIVTEDSSSPPSLQGISERAGENSLTLSWQEYLSGNIVDALSLPSVQYDEQAISTFGTLSASDSLYKFSEEDVARSLKIKEMKRTPLLSVPGEIVVKYRQGGGSFLQASGVMSSVRTATASPFGLFKLVFEDVPAATRALEAFARDTNVEYASPNYLFTIEDIPSDPLFGELWGLHNAGGQGGIRDADVDAPEAWDIENGDSADVVVAVLDTGVDYTHPDLAGNIWINRGEVAGNGIDDDANGFVDDVRGWDMTRCNDHSLSGSCIQQKQRDNNPMDEHYHGTHIAGTIGALGGNGIGIIGLNRYVKIMPVRVLDRSGVGELFDIVGGLYYAIQNGAQVVNMSFGNEIFSQPFFDGVLEAANRGIVIVAAAGNGGDDDVGDNNDLQPFYPASYRSENVFAVAASGRNDTLAGFSNFGSSSVHLAAPGTLIMSTMPGNQYGVLSGTSMAVPHVSGLVSLLLSFHPNLPISDTRRILLNSVDVKETLLGKVRTGGRLNAYKALQRLQISDDFSRISIYRNSDPFQIPEEGMSIASTTDLTLSSYTDWSVLSEGQYYYALVVQDKVGHASTPTFSNLARLNTPPLSTSLNAEQDEGDVRISYDLFDREDANVSVSFEYWSGTVWRGMNAVVGSGTVPVGVGKSAIWHAKQELPGFDGDMKIKVTADDGNEFHGRGVQESSPFHLDTKNPNTPSSTAVFLTNRATTTIFGIKEVATVIMINGEESVSETSSTEWSFVVSLVEGDNEFFISARDMFGNESIPYRVMITRDSTEPVIMILGTNPIHIEFGSAYVDAGATAMDNVDGNLTANIVTTSTVNTSVVGTYLVRYNVSDAAGNAALEVTRTVHVLPPIFYSLFSSLFLIE